CYWMEETDIEAYSLQREKEPGILLTFLNHKKEPTDITLSFDAEKAGLDINKPLYGWYLDSKSFEELKRNPAPNLFNIKDIRRYTKVNNRRIEITIKNVVPNVAKQIYITNTPAFVWNIAGKPTQVKGIHILDTFIQQKGKNLFEISCKRSSSILYVLNKKKPVKVFMDRKEINSQILFVGKTPAVMFNVPPGKHTIYVKK
ncbi:hypothetical protein J7K25_05755, partial [bacterium]|nr:hypothetical protein [bacterium]